MKTRRTFAFAVFGIVLLLLVSCGGGSLSKPQNGTYKSDDELLSQTWTFSGDNNITLSASLISSKGTYRIDGETLYITSSLFGTETTSSYTITEISRDSFFIDGTKFIKQ